MTKTPKKEPQLTQNQCANLLNGAAWKAMMTWLDHKIETIKDDALKFTARMSRDDDAKAKAEELALKAEHYQELKEMMTTKLKNSVN